MVAQQFLVLLVGVQIPVGLPLLKGPAIYCRALFFDALSYVAYCTF